MKHIYILIIFVLFSITNILSQERTTLTHAINIAGKQRMLGQRIAKDILYIKYSNIPDSANKELEGAIIMFEDGLEVLKNYAPTEELRYKIAIQEFAYEKYLKNLLTKSEKSIEEIIKTNTLFLAICDDVVTGLINYSNIIDKNKELIKKIAEVSGPSKELEFTNAKKEKKKKYLIRKTAEATGASGKLRYLTQRLALYYIINKSKVKKINPFEIDVIINTIDSNLNYLTLLEFNTIEISDVLSEIHFHLNNLKQLLYIDDYIDMNSTKISIEELYKMSNVILDKADIATKLYADLSDI